MWLKSKLIIVILVLIGFGAGAAGFMYIGNLMQPHQQQIIKEEEPQVEVPPTPKTDNMEVDEEWLELPRERNLVVIIDNDVRTRPQAGLAQGDLVYEIPIEGGTTRFMAIFSRFNADLIGPIRSARDYTIEIAQEYDPVFVHAGGSPQAFALFDKIGNLNGLEGGVDRAFWRTNGIEPPFNLFSDSKTLRRVSKQEGFREEGKLHDFKYLEPGQEFSDSKAEKITIDYGHSDYRGEFLYDKGLQKYLRFTGGVKHWDRNGEQLKVKNIILQKVNTKIIDSEGRLSLEIFGRGMAVFFSEGQVVQGYWEKKAGGVTKYYKAEGEEVALNEGNTWICIIPHNVSVVY
ncbi:MAG: DUF3048 domain-containing protein [Bacillota bacterium]